MSDNTSTQTEQANQLPPCDPEVFSNGVSLGLFEMPKDKAESLCEALRLATGYKIDWHYFAGRVHIKALPAKQEDSELSRVKAASIEAMCRAYQAETRAEKAESKNVRLTKERDWLASKLATMHPDCPLKYLEQRPLGWKCHEGSQGPCTKTQAARCWAEAARRAVAKKGE